MLTLVMPDCLYRIHDRRERAKRNVFIGAQ